MEEKSQRKKKWKQSAGWRSNSIWYTVIDIPITGVSARRETVRSLTGGGSSIKAITKVLFFCLLFMLRDEMKSLSYEPDVVIIMMDRLWYEWDDARLNGVSNRIQPNNYRTHKRWHLASHTFDLLAPFKNGENVLKRRLIDRACCSRRVVRDWLQ